MKVYYFILLYSFIGFIIGFMLGRNKVVFRVKLIQEDFADLLKKYGMPDRISTENACQWLEEKLEKKT